MATSSSALLSPATFSAAIPQKNLNSISFHGLRPLRNLGGNSSALPNLSRARGSRSSSADSSSSTSRERTRRNRYQNAKTHFEAGDDRTKEYARRQSTEIERSCWIQHRRCTRLGINRTHRCLLHFSHFQQRLRS